MPDAEPDPEAVLRGCLADKTRRIDQLEAQAEAGRRAAARVAELEAAYGDLTRARDADLVAKADLEADHAAQLLHLQETAQRLAEAHRQAQARLAQLALAQARAAALLAEREAWGLRLKASRRAEREASRAEIARIRASTRWRAGDLIVRTCRKRGWRKLALPWRLVGFWRAEARRR